MAANSNIHVVPNGDDWSVRRENSQRATSNHPTQSDAIDAARGIARREHGELHIHRPNGQIRDRDSYGNDPSSRKG